MKQIISIIILFFSTVLCFGSTQLLTEPQDIKALQEQYKALIKTQDSLQVLLNVGRSKFATADDELKKSLSSDIIRYEGEIFEIKSKVSQIGSQITSIESDFAIQSLDEMQTQNQNPSVQSATLYENEFIVDNISKQQLKELVSSSTIEMEAEAALGAIVPIYKQLEGLKIKYNLSRNQSELDSIITVSEKLKAQINELDSHIGAEWVENYNSLYDTYLVLLDKAPYSDRTTLEAIEVEGREIRRQEAFQQEGSLIPNLAAFNYQRKYLLSYERAIAKSAELTLAEDALNSKKIIELRTEFKDIEFLPKVLTLYSDVELEFDYPYTEVDDVPEMILPEKGVYYTVQIALMSKKPEEVAFFKGVGPMQVETISATKLRYCVAGFNNYEQAMDAVAILKKKGLKAPTLICYLDGEVTTAAKARAKESEVPVVGSFKVVVTSSEENISAILREAMDMHAKGKSIIRLAKGAEFQFTISEFGSSEEAEVFAQILKTKTQNSKIEVSEIKTDDTEK